MNADEIVAFFVDEVSPIYNSFQEKDKKIYYAILQSLPPFLLDEVVSRLSSDERIPWDLKGFIGWMQKDHHQEIVRPNEATTTLLRWYRDKNSKKVGYAYRRLVQRFEAQSLADQIRILRAFLAGSKSTSEWAATRLRRNRIAGLEKEIEVAWKAYKGPSMALTVIYMMPVEFVMKEQEELVEASDRPDAYAILCGRLGRTPGFHIDENRLSILDWFYVVGKLGLSDRITEMDEKVIQYVRNLNSEEYVGIEMPLKNGLLYLLGMNRIIWSMKQLHYTEGLIQLSKMQQKAENQVQGTSVKERVSLAVDYLKSLVFGSSLY